jgi:hypothetical protein
VLALDHIPKPSPGASLAYARPWGSFAKRAKTRHAVLVTQAEAGGIILRVSKSNLDRPGAMVGADITWEGDAIRVTAVPLDDEALAGIEHHLPALEQVYRCLCQHEAMTPEEVAEETGLAVGTVRNKLTALRRQGRAEPLGDGRWRGIGPATLAVRDDGHSPFTHYIGGVNGESEPNDRHSPGDSSQPTLVVRDDGHRPFTVHSLYRGVNSESEPNGRRSPGDSSQPTLVEQEPPDDVIAWGEWLLAELRAGRVRLPPVELRPGHTVLDAERFLASHLAEARLGISTALENLRRYRRVVEAVSGQRRGKE